MKSLLHNVQSSLLVMLMLFLSNSVLADERINLTSDKIEASTSFNKDGSILPLEEALKMARGMQEINRQEFGFTSGLDPEDSCKIKLSFKVVDCPPNCTSVLGGACWVCVEVTGGDITCG